MTTLLTEGELAIQGSDLLSAVWYSDGSGASGIRSGLDSIPDDWQITHVRLLDEYVLISIKRKDLEVR